MSEVSDAARHGLLRRTARRALLRHLCVAALTAVLLAVFAAVHAQWSPMHRWNRAFGDASLAWAVVRVRSIDPPAPTWAPSPDARARRRTDRGRRQRSRRRRR